MARVEPLRLGAVALAHGREPALRLQPLEHQARDVPAEGRRRVEHGAFVGHRLVVPDRRACRGAPCRSGPRARSPRTGPAGRCSSARRRRSGRTSTRRWGATGCVEDMSATSGTLPRRRHVGKLDAADGFVRRVVQVRGARRQLQRGLRGHGGVARGRLVGGDVDLAAVALGLADGLLRPGAGVDVVDRRVRAARGSSGWRRTARWRRPAGTAPCSCAGMASSSRRSASASCATAMKALLRWLTSITDMPAAASRSARRGPVPELRAAAWPGPRRN